MKQNQFTERYQNQWHQFSLQLDALNKKKNAVAIDPRFIEKYTELCSHLAMAKERNYSIALISYLQELATQGHQFVYQRKTDALKRSLDFIAFGFPQSLRKEWKAIFWAGLIFYGSFFLMLFLVMMDPDIALKIHSASELEQYRQMYSPDAPTLGQGAIREHDTNFMMFGFYIFNNIGIGFITFAMGIFFGAGSLFILLTNGLSIGTTAGYLSLYDSATPFWTFVIAHSPFELNAIVIAGAAGFKLGWAIINPRGYSRLTALKIQARNSIPLMWGATFFLFIAAFIEAYWSSIGLNGLSASIKYTVGGILWALVIWYFIFAGRTHEVK